MIGEVIGDVSGTINEEHPLELERVEEFDRFAEQLSESTQHSVFDGLLAIGVLDDRSVNDGVGGRDQKASHTACKDFLPN